MSDREKVIAFYSAKTYIGDSVYAHFDGYHFILETMNGLPNDPSNTIALEPPVFEKLITYRDGCYKAFELLRERERDERAPSSS